MAFDSGLAARLHEYFQGRHDVVVKEMFGGVCFLLYGHMCCGIMGDRLMARVGSANYDNYLSKPHVTAMDFTGKPLRGLLYVMPKGFESDTDLTAWVEVCIAFVGTLPPKKTKKKGSKKTA